MAKKKTVKKLTTEQAAALQVYDALDTLLTNMYDAGDTTDPSEESGTPPEHACEKA